MSRHVRGMLGVLCLGMTLAGCQGIPGLFGPVAGAPGDQSPFSNNGIIANNTASLSGQVLAPSSLVANNSASLIGNNSGALVGNNSAALVSNNASAYRTASVQELPVIKAIVEAVRDGEVVAKATTDDAGRYTLANLPKEKAYLLRVSFNLDGTKFQELAIAKTLNQLTGNNVNSASTLVTAKVVKQGTAFEQVNMARYHDTVNLVSSTQTSIDPASLTSTDNSAAAFDQLAQSNQQVKDTYTEAVTPASTSPTPTPAPTATPETTYAPRDYFFPASSTAKAEFLTTETTTGQTPATGSFKVQVTGYSVNEATIRRTIGSDTFDTTLQMSGSIVKMITRTTGLPDYTLSMGTPVFTTGGMVVSPVGAEETVTYKLLAASEQVTIKSKTYDCVKLLETTVAGQAQSERTLWYAKGYGLGPVKVLRVTQAGQSTTTTETVMTSFTP